ncbi:class I SAM-dependent methyltransferase [Asticcacaulis sp. AC460]|uniref:class I SAM-dependent methyltransferase n=1 Tax=Asticcacaulis sp. AC460 TaxID=1282360 RepID=UPI00138AB2E8|nr:class I SAM-dependent methyltransferase [Asticcacaulis sp. AC460]
MHELTKRHQTHTKTFHGRHADIFRSARRLFGRRKKLKVLSFGCSTGEECLDLAEVFRYSDITGVDVDQEALKKAAHIHHPRISIMDSTEGNLRAHGPFDAIFAMNVFCVFPKSKQFEDISHLYPITHFDDGLRLLHRHLAHGGILGLFNAAYFFDDFSLFDAYQPEARGFPPYGSWMVRHKPDGRRANRNVVLFRGDELTEDEWIEMKRQDKTLQANGIRQEWINPETCAHLLHDVTLWRKIKD